MDAATYFNKNVEAAERPCPREASSSKAIQTDIIKETAIKKYLMEDATT